MHCALDNCTCVVSVLRALCWDKVVNCWCLQVGPTGAQVGLLACLIVEVLNARPMLKHPNRALLKLIAITVVLFLCGLLPWVDNYAHLFGFFFGFLLSYALMPYISFGPYDRQKKVALIWVCLLSSLFLFTALVILFYVIPVYDCEVCSFLNCLPLTQDFCASQNINFKRQEPVVWRKWVRLVGTVCATNFTVTVSSHCRARLEVRVVQGRTLCPDGLWLRRKWNPFKSICHVPSILHMENLQRGYGPQTGKFKFK